VPRMTPSAGKVCVDRQVPVRFQASCIEQVVPLTTAGLLFGANCLANWPGSAA
jgi:hypothetical protein